MHSAYIINKGISVITLSNRLITSVEGEIAIHHNHYKIRAILLHYLQVRVEIIVVVRLQQDFFESYKAAMAELCFSNGS